VCMTRKMSISVLLTFFWASILQITKKRDIQQALHVVRIMKKEVSDIPLGKQYQNSFRINMTRTPTNPKRKPKEIKMKI
jgi:hypothetical protein